MWHYILIPLLATTIAVCGGCYDKDAADRVINETPNTQTTSGESNVGNSAESLMAEEEAAPLDEKSAIDALKKDAIVHLTFDDSGRVIAAQARFRTADVWPLLAKIPSIRSIDLQHDTLDEEAVEQLSKLPNLEKLCLRYSEITDRAMKHLSSMSSLIDLDLSENSKITDEGIKHLENLTNLRHLNLKGAQITAAGLFHLRKMTELESLNVQNVLYNSEGISHLVGMKQLKVLTISGLVNDVNALAELTSLEQLVPDHLPAMGDDEMEVLSRLNKLESLSITAKDYASDQFLQSIGKMRGLKKLVLGIQFGNIDPDALRHLSNLPQLEELLLTYKELGEATAHLAAIKSLKRLILSSSDSMDLEVEHLPPLPGLRSLTLDGGKLTDDGLKHVYRQTSLAHLDLMFNRRLSDAGLEPIDKLEDLKYLNLQGIPISGSGLAHLTKLKNLEELILYDTKVDDDSLEQLQALTKLRNLNLGKTAISDAGLVHLKKIGSLRYVNLIDARVTKEGALNLQNALEKGIVQGP